MQRRAASLTAAIAAAIAATHLQAAEIYWQGGIGNLTDSNYTDGTNSNLPATSADALNLGASGAISNSATGVIIDGLRVGHNEATLPGSATLDLTAGDVTVNGTTLLGGGPTGSVIVGANSDGTLNLSGGTLTLSLGAMFVGYDSPGDTITGTGTGTLNVSGSGVLDVQDNRLGIGDGNAGSVVVSDNGTIRTSRATGNADLIIGVNATSSFLQSGGSVEINRDIIIGRRTADNTTVTLSGGTFFGDELSLADDGSPGNTTQSDTADNVLLDVQGGSFSVSQSAFIGRNQADGTTLSISDGSFTTGNNVEVGLDEATNTTMDVSGGTVTIGTIDTSGGTFVVGRGGSTNTTFNLSGGSVTVQAGVSGTGAPAEGLFVMADQAGAITIPAPVNVVTNHSGGSLNVRGVVIGDNLGGSTTPGSNNATYNLSGTGVINASSYTIIGRRLEGTMIQTGGTANLGDLSIGNNQGASTDPSVSGLYEISGGGLNTNSIAIAPNGTDALPAGLGELRVVGDDSTISSTGDFVSSSAGTLAFELEGGELLTLINISGIATFEAGAQLVLDESGAAPSLSSYDLLTATSIVDNGIAFGGPAGWSYQIVSGGNGQILQVVVPEPGVFGLAAMAGLMTLARRRRSA